MIHVERSDSPRAIVHTRILDVAAERPDASLEEIAGEVSAATPELVDRVLEEYGDPADSNPESGLHSHSPMPQDVTSDTTAQNGRDHPVKDGDGNGESEDGSTEMASSATSLSMTEKQRETLVAVQERPEASQGEIAEALDVTRATVSRRLNDIEGFSWDEREDFASAHLDSAGVAAADEVSSDVSSAENSAVSPEFEGDGSPEIDPDETAEVDALADRLASVEGRLDDVERGPDKPALDPVERGPDKPALDPELVHKVAHACMESEAISREEELQVLEHLMG